MKIKLLIILMIAGLTGSAQVTTFNPYGVQKYATGDSLRLVGSASGQYLYLPTTKMLRSYNLTFQDGLTRNGNEVVIGGDYRDDNGIYIGNTNNRSHAAFVLKSNYGAFGQKTAGFQVSGDAMVTMGVSPNDNFSSKIEVSPFNNGIEIRDDYNMKGAQYHSSKYRNKFTDSSLVDQGAVWNQIDTVNGKQNMPGQSIYLMSSFRNNDNKLYLSLSNDGKSWNTLKKDGSYTAPDEVRDPSILFYNNKYYIIHTAGSFGYVRFVSLLVSTDLQNWTKLMDIPTPTNVNGINNTATWAPEWFLDDNGSLPTIQYSTTYDGVTHFAFYSQALNKDLTSWSSPISITGTSGMPNAIDFEIIKKGDGFYYLWYKNESTQQIEVMKSTLPYSGYTYFKTGNWAGWGTGLEGASLVKNGDGSWRIYLDRYSTFTGEEYSDSFDDWATWSPLVKINSPIIARHATVKRTNSIPVFRNAVTTALAGSAASDTWNDVVQRGAEVNASSNLFLRLNRQNSSINLGNVWNTNGGDQWFFGQRSTGDSDLHLFNFSTGQSQAIFKQDNSFLLNGLSGSGDRPVFAGSDGTLKIGTIPSQVQNSLSPSSTTLAPSVNAVNSGLSSKLNTNNPTATGTFTTPNLTVTNFGGGVLYSDASGNINNVAVLPVSLGGTGVTGSTGTGSTFVLSNAPTLINPQVGTQAVNDNSVKAASTAYVDRAGNNYVDKTTNQTIAGVKTFSSDLVVNGLAIGRGAGNVASNTYIGYNAAGSNTTGANNTSLGYNSLSGVSTGNNNVGIGYQAGISAGNGNGNIYIGSNSTASTTGLDNTVVIGNSASVDASNKVQIGNSSVTTLGISQTIITGANIAKTLALPSASGTLALISDLAGKANISGGNSFTGVQSFTNGSVQPLVGFQNSGFINTLSSNTLSTNVSTYLPQNGGILATIDDLTQTVSVSGTSQSLSSNRIYIPHNASLTTFSLPTTASEGQLFQIVGEGAGGWRIAQNASQQIVGVNVATTSGTTGYVQSTNSNCTITIRCTVANSKFTITSSQGTLTIN